MNMEEILCTLGLVFTFMVFIYLKEFLER